MELRSDYLPITVNAFNAHSGPPTTPPTVDTYSGPPTTPPTADNYSVPPTTSSTNGVVTGDLNDVSW